LYASRTGRVERRECGGIGGDEIGEFAQYSRSLARRAACPVALLERAERVLHGVVDHRVIGDRHRCIRDAIRWPRDLDARRARIDQFAADEMPAPDDDAGRIEPVHMRESSSVMLR
jgi:hypothetical protein